MNNKDGSFTSYSTKDELPIEVGVNSLIRVFFGRFLSVVIAVVTIIIYLGLAWILAYYSQVVSFAFLLLAGVILSLFIYSLFRKKITQIDLIVKRIIDISVSTL